jgi:hypothetical protein
MRTARPYLGGAGGGRGTAARGLGELDAFVRAEIESNANLIKAAGIAPN